MHWPLLSLLPGMFCSRVLMLGPQMFNVAHVIAKHFFAERAVVLAVRPEEMVLKQRHIRARLKICKQFKE
jgi:hypothetical protein